MNPLHAAAFLAALSALAGCAGNPATACLAGEHPAILDRLYFGTDSPQGTVTPEQWRRFLDLEVTPRFPKGLTTWDASGQWQANDGVVRPETAHLLHIVHPGDPASERSLHTIIDLYKSEFRQEAVLRVRSSVCVSF